MTNGHRHRGGGRQPGGHRCRPGKHGEVYCAATLADHGWTPDPPYAETIAGMQLLGLILMSSGLSCSSLPRSTGCAVYGIPSSSSRIETLRPFGVVQV